MALAAVDAFLICCIAAGGSCPLLMYPRSAALSAESWLAEVVRSFVSVAVSAPATFPG